MPDILVKQESGAFQRWIDNGDGTHSPQVAGAGGGGGGTGDSVTVSNFPAVQAVSAASLPLPSGAATAAGVTAVANNIGAATARAAVTDPAAAADINQLLRGILTALNAHTALLAEIRDNTAAG